MSATLTNSANLWQRVVASHQQYSQAFSDFLKNSPDKVEVLRKALRGKERWLALRTVPSLNVDEKKALLADWVNLARAAHSPFQIAWTVIESLPRDWLLKHIEKEVDAILRDENETDYWMFLQLYATLDQALTQKLARRAANHADPEIRELGESYLTSKKSLEELNLSVRARKCMARLGISSIQDLLQRTDDELLNAKNFGMTTLNEVREKLGSLGLKLRGD